MKRRIDASDSGFTLIELLISITLVGIIAAPLANVVIDYMLNSTTASARIKESHDAQIAAAYWQQDVASLGKRGSYDTDLKTFPLQSSVNVADCSLPAGSTKVISLSWNEYNSAGSPTVDTVTYVTQSSGRQLVRIACGGQSSTATLTNSLSGAPTCSFDPPNVNNPTFGACTGGGGTPPPSTIILRLSVADSSGKGQAYNVSLTGQRRQT